ncbi:MAG: aspartate aminotransferase family protein [Cytophagales bacterium]|nr:aspartate aminotransferase family protein [Cytophagales bacterium]MCA6368591.1 aspartate aminotransferase family protein [Cytophagales bacterium]MCA6370247.1 aspartate aminotransferase family protein [Cytophagales bacterium]MCA6374614.1 aspartate aminotransferase family protein [Cytophagales bacterium]MCA6385085.1 aspartate aminotransferase family protein [Cytophagales bacterium]
MDYSEDTFFKKLAPTSPHPFLISVERAEGVYLYSATGKRYIDMISGIAVSNVGHRHPKIVKAIKDQVDKYLHVMVYGEYIQSPSNLLAEKLTSLLPPNLNCCYFVNSGTEANEAALKLAKRVTGRTEMIACRKSYHGSTHGSLSISGNEVKKRAFRPLLPDVNFIDFNNPGDLDQITERTACVIMETIQGDAGVRIPSKEYLQAVRKKCTATGTLLIFDEIQCGMGRTGKLFAFEHFDVVPDILTLAKSFGGGLPIGSFISSFENMQTLASKPMLGHITTFGGNPVCCASALAVLEIIEEENLLTTVEAKGKLIEDLLRHSKVKEVRRFGLLFAFDFDSEERVNRIVQYAKEHGVICYWFLSHPNSFRIAPPLTITEAEIREACAIILQAIDNS